MAPRRSRKRRKGTGRVTRPVLVYGILEAGIALSALAVPLLLLAARALYAALLYAINTAGAVCGTVIAPLQLGVRRKVGRVRHDVRHDVLQKRFDAGYPFAQLCDVAG